MKQIIITAIIFTLANLHGLEVQRIKHNSITFKLNIEPKQKLKISLGRLTSIEPFYEQMKGTVTIQLDGNQLNDYTDFKGKKSKKSGKNLLAEAKDFKIYKKEERRQTDRGLVFGSCTINGKKEEIYIKIDKD